MKDNAQDQVLTSLLKSRTVYEGVSSSSVKINTGGSPSIASLNSKHPRAKRTTI